MQSKCHLAGNRKARKYSTVLKSALSSVHLEKITTSKGEYEKALAEHEQSRAIGVELSDRRGEGVHCNNLGMSHVSLKQYEERSSGSSSLWLSRKSLATGQSR